MKSLYDEKPTLTFGRSMVGVIMLAFLGISIITRGYRDKQEFYSVTGAILNVPGSIVDKSDSEANAKKTRYFLIDGYSKIFAIPVGKDFGDSTPSFERVDALNQGDTITVYFDENKNSNAYFNRLVQFIDKNQKPYFIRGNQDIYWGCSAIVTSVIIATLLFFYKKQGKII